MNLTTSASMYRPTFQAQFSKDKETKAILNNHISNGVNAIFTYDTIELLNEIDSKDSISLSISEDKNYNKTLTVKNECTGKKINLPSDDIDISNCINIKLPKILRKPDDPEYKELFGDSKFLNDMAKSCYSYSKYTTAKLNKDSGFDDIQRKIDILEEKNKELELEIERNEDKIDTLQEQKWTIREKYVKSLINGGYNNTEE